MLYRDTVQGDVARLVRRCEKAVWLEIVDGVHGEDGQRVCFDNAAFERQWVRLEGRHELEAVPARRRPS